MAYKSMLLVTDPASTNNFHIYPNPASDELSVELNANSPRVDEIEIIGVLGDKIFCPFYSMISKIKIDLTGISQGAFFIRLKTENGILEKRFIRM